MSYPVEVSINEHQSAHFNFITLPQYETESFDRTIIVNRIEDVGAELVYSRRKPLRGKGFLETQTHIPFVNNQTGPTRWESNNRVCRTKAREGNYYKQHNSPFISRRS